MLPGVLLPAIAAPSMPAGCLRCRHSERRTGGDASVAGHQDRPLAFKKANDDLTQRMERLPPGHPSSPYNDDGTRKPPVARPADRELPLPDEQAADTGLDSPDAEEPRQRSLDTQDLTDQGLPSLEADGPESVGQEIRGGEPSADEVPGRDSQQREAPASEQPSPEAATPDSRSWGDSLSHFKEQWERHKERWPQEQRPPVDHSTDEPGSWRGEGDQYLNAEESLVAGHSLESIRPIEEKVSATVQEVKAEVPDCDLVGLGNRLKGEERFKEKVSDELQGKPDRSIAEITERMPDAIRYTFQLDADRYAAGYWNIRDRLELIGSEHIMSRNSWDDPEYKGVNTRWLSPEGQVFEVQFHTPESYQAKQLTHTAYERLRTGPAPGAERPELEAFQEDVSTRIPTPQGALAIPNFRRKGY